MCRHTRDMYTTCMRCIDTVRVPAFKSFKLNQIHGNEHRKPEREAEEKKKTTTKSILNAKMSRKKKPELNNKPKHMANRTDALV